MIRFIKFNPRGTLAPLLTDLERMRQKHKDNDFGMSLGDSLERENESFPFGDDDDASEF